MGGLQGAVCLSRVPASVHQLYETPVGLIRLLKYVNSFQLILDEKEMKTVFPETSANALEEVKSSIPLCTPMGSNDVRVVNVEGN